MAGVPPQRYAPKPNRNPIAILRHSFIVPPSHAPDDVRITCSHQKHYTNANEEGGNDNPLPCGIADKKLTLCLTIQIICSGVGVIILTGEGDLSFCSGGDQSVRGEGGYDDGSEDVPRLRVLDLHIQMRRCPKPIIAMVAGYAIGGGHILHMVADLTIAADNAIFGQTGPKVGRYIQKYSKCSILIR